MNEKYEKYLRKQITHSLLDSIFIFKNMKT